MEGLIPCMYRAITRNKTRRFYHSIALPTDAGELVLSPYNQSDFDTGDSHDLTTRTMSVGLCENQIGDPNLRITQRSKSVSSSFSPAQRAKGKLGSIHRMLSGSKGLRAHDLSQSQV